MTVQSESHLILCIGGLNQGGEEDQYTIDMEKVTFESYHSLFIINDQKIHIY